ncbi:restriction endonuclease subunit S [Streptococcus suis]|nr:restriction endonuclease subunit S [Streptococcus suis]NQO11486.1 restriction endonuclease subunit S [Streptococcus suis]NQO72548.1 restriction endonuclease subunit S [Streptococcus suis]HEM5421640.1 restriction endonuclease subunit S [Streptococcus suis]HEM5427796.1 restriction endonuclease subunit S [Streptococcus suis]
MTKEKSTVPRLRFPGFTDAWKQRKLGEVLKERNESRSPSADVPLVSFTVENGVTPKTERYNREFLVRDEDKKYKFTQLDDIVYNPANLKFGAIARNKYGAAVFSPIYVTYGVLSEAHPLFVELIVTSTNFIQRALRYQEGTVYERMAVKSFDLLRSEIPLPTLPEQEVIGSFFSDLDQLITLHQRKLDEVKELKKALLQKMFPKGNGNDFPELRFPGFTDAWKQRKLGEVAVVVMGQSPDSKNYTNNPLDNILVQGNADLKNGNVEPRVWTTQITKIAEKGDIIVSVRAPVGDVAKTSYKVVLGRGVAGIKGNDFIYQTLIRMKQFGYWMKLSTGSTFESINSGDIKSSLIPLPSLPEQEAIGNFFSDLDQLITLHQRQLDHLKLLKKALLQQMFI